MRSAIAVVLVALAWTGCGPPPRQQVDQMFTGDADQRREAIVGLSGKEWGLKEPYLKGYAALAKSDTDPSVRSAAVTALGRGGEAKYLPEIVGALGDPSVAVRWDAARALDRVVGETAVGPLRAHLQGDTSLDVRITCAHSLRHYPTTEVVSALIAGLADSSFSLNYEAHASLVEMTGQDFGPGLAEWQAAVAAGKVKPHPVAGESPAQRPWWDWFGTQRKE
jgi:hypothetical protein